MNTSRRGFLGALLAASAAPAIVRAESLMKLWVPPQGIALVDGSQYATATDVVNLGQRFADDIGKTLRPFSYHLVVWDTAGKIRLIPSDNPHFFANTTR